MDIEKIVMQLLEVIEEQNKETKEWRKHDIAKLKYICKCIGIVAVSVVVLLGFMTYCMYFSEPNYSIDGDNNYNTNSEITNGVDK